jgi:hypothetical protein
MKKYGAIVSLVTGPPFGKRPYCIEYLTYTYQVYTFDNIYVDRVRNSLYFVDTTLPQNILTDTIYMDSNIRHSK